MAETESTKTPAATPAYVTALEDLLVRARAGLIHAVAFVAVSKDHQIVRVIESVGPMRNHLAAAVGDLFYTIYAEREMEYAERAGLPAEPEKVQEAA